MKNNKLEAIQKLLTQKGIDYYLIPNSDEFFSEYPASYAKRIEYLTGFSGSFAIVVIPQEGIPYLFTDGRYTTQAKLECGQAYKILNIREQNISNFFNGHDKLIIGFDPKVCSKQFIDSLKNSCPNYQFEITENLVDLIWENKPTYPSSPAFTLPLNMVGNTVSSKLAPLVGMIIASHADYLLFTNPETICWLLNLRSHDLEYTPVLLCYALIDVQGNIALFLNKADRLRDVKLDSDIKLEMHELSKLEEILSNKLSGKTIIYDAANSNIYFDNLLNTQAKVIHTNDTTLILRAQKNNIEIKAIEHAHLLDAVSVINSLYNISTMINEQASLDEMKVDQILLHERSKHDDFLFPSFSTIAGFNENGAIIHYRANHNTNKVINGNGLLLIDSGGQYYSGTTDITRTILIGDTAAKFSKYYTAVLKGHIDLALARFPANTTGSQLDCLARKYIWELGLDYDHGTGHGVGMCLNVHEGPQRISKTPSSQALLPGMLLSNEPGIYKVGQFGIRIENLMYVKQGQDGFLSFKQLTLVPYEKNLIDFSSLSPHQYEWLKAYYNDIKSQILPKIEDLKASKWLTEQIAI
ncbi:aminopeptidase P family protein [Rickettsiales endosymbiont of Stachyamoeba lipophora]|uniref:aminopeptidase P family protein n=1 Tax=Rickettsiales endosymbiont of Stachyamoeba lipophora TaxID=2486578 RepID=UPI000F64FB5E|nr:aminopeptidase P family protein [Rickettsiales endosymbiont of Stachyamoeba lipophora]AZL14972.1 aminopeptidase P family protein [Rickettsiales endosymbiont of Stachyamoeba lipophora]